MSKSTLTMFAVVLVSLLVVVTANPAPYSNASACVTETLISPQVGLGPTRTVFISTETTTSSLDCHGCSLIAKTVFPIPDILPFQTTVTKECTTTTSYVCASGIGGPIGATTLPTPVTGLHREGSLGDPTRHAVQPPFGGEAQRLVIEFATAIYIDEVINNGGALQEVCDTLNVTVLYLEGLDGALAKQRICAAAANPPPPANASAFNDIIALATALYAAEVAGNYAGGTNLTNLCNVIDVQTISRLGFNGASVKDFVCKAAAEATTAPACSVDSSATAPASPVNPTAVLHSIITVHSTVTLHSVITLRPSGTVPADGLVTSSGKPSTRGGYY